MPSDTALTLVNKVLRITGDYEPVTTVVGSPANIAERIIDFLNITLDDIVRKIEFRELLTGFQAAGNGVDSEFIQNGVTARSRDIRSVFVDSNPRLEQVSETKFTEMRNTNAVSGVPAIFMAISGPNGELGVNIYPTPANGSTVSVAGSIQPTHFTVDDASTTEIMENDLFVLGAVAHSDAFSGMDRGYMQLYEAAKARAWHNIYEHQQFRIETEDYH